MNNYFSFGQSGCVLQVFRGNRQIWKLPERWTFAKLFNVDDGRSARTECQGYGSMALQGKCAASGNDVNLIVAIHLRALHHFISSVFQLPDSQVDVLQGLGGIENDNF